MGDLKSGINLNEFLKEISIKKHYIKKLKNQLSTLQSVKQKNYKLLNKNLFDNKFNSMKSDLVIMYIIDISFSRSNTLLHVTDYLGKLKFFCSAGDLQHKGKSKRFRFQVFKSIYRLLVTRLDFLAGKPVALHLKNVRFNRSWLIRKLKYKFFIRTVKSFDLFPHNGCRKKKVRRKKMKKLMKI